MLEGAANISASRACRGLRVTEGAALKTFLSLGWPPVVFPVNTNIPPALERKCKLIWPSLPVLERGVVVCVFLWVVVWCSVLLRVVCRVVVLFCLVRRYFCFVVVCLGVFFFSCARCLCFRLCVGVVRVRVLFALSGWRLVFSCPSWLFSTGVSLSCPLSLPSQAQIGRPDSTYRSTLGNPLQKEQNLCFVACADCVVILCGPFVSVDLVQSDLFARSMQPVAAGPFAPRCGVPLCCSRLGLCSRLGRSVRRGIKH